MSDEIFDDSDKPKIVEHIKKFIKTNGYVSTRFACLDGVKRADGTNKNWASDLHRDAFVNSVSSMLFNTGEYLRRQNELGYDYDVFFNPDFILQRKTKNIYKTSMWLAVVAILISLFSIFKNDLFPNNREQEVHQIEILYRSSIKEINSLKDSITAINNKIAKKKF